VNADLNVQPPVAEELWQQVPPPVKSALLEAWEQAERRCRSLEKQLRELQTHLSQRDGFTTSTPSVLNTSEQANPDSAAHEAEPSRRHRHRHRYRYRSPRAMRRRLWKAGVALLGFLFWPAVVLAVAVILWGLLQWIDPGRARAIL
jgi:hypothetical protein